MDLLKKYVTIEKIQSFITCHKINQKDFKNNWEIQNHLA